MRLHSAPTVASKGNCTYVAIATMLWLMGKPATQWGTPLNLRHFAKTGLQCRQILHDAGHWASNPRAVNLCSTGCAPTVLREMQAAADALGRVLGKGLATYATLSGNILPLVLCHWMVVHSEVAVASSYDSQAEPSSRSHQARPQAPAGTRQRKCRQNAPRHMTGWSAKAAKGQVPVRLVTSTRTVMDYILGRG